jgi:hypothetical protein
MRRSKPPHGKEIYLETQYNEPFTPNSVGNRFHDQCKDAGVSRIAPVFTLTSL